MYLGTKTEWMRILLWNKMHLTLSSLFVYTSSGIYTLHSSNVRKPIWMVGNELLLCYCRTFIYHSQQRTHVENVISRTNNSEWENKNIFVSIRRTQTFRVVLKIWENNLLPCHFFCFRFPFAGMANTSRRHISIGRCVYVFVYNAWYTFLVFIGIFSCLGSGQCLKWSERNIRKMCEESRIWTFGEFDVCVLFLIKQRAETYYVNTNRCTHWNICACTHTHSYMTQ